jgi:competence protein ComEC
LDLVQPEIAVISCGINNTFKHPHPETLEHFSERGIPFFRTDLDGRVEVATGENGLAVETVNGVKNFR